MFRAPILPSENILQPNLTLADFTPESIGRMQGVNPALRDLMMEVERRANEQGYNLQVSEGLRDPRRQEQLVSEGKSQTTNSRHLTGNAIDVHLLNPDGSANWDFEAYAPIADIAKEVAAERGLENFVWGGDWQSLKDGVHFELNDANYTPSPEQQRAAGYERRATDTQRLALEAYKAGDMTKSEAARFVSEDLLDAIEPEESWLDSLADAAKYMDFAGVGQAQKLPSPGRLSTSINRGTRNVGSSALQRFGLASLV